MTTDISLHVPDGYRVVDLPASPALALSFLRAGLRSAGVGGGGKDLPRTVLRRSGVAVSRAHVARYAALVGAPPDGPLPLLYPNAVSFPLQMAIMTAPGFPFPVIGLVHLDNTVHRHRALVASAPLDVEVRAENLRPHRLGRVLDVVTVVRQGGHVAWVQVGTFLRRGRSEGTDAARASAGASPRGAGSVPAAGAAPPAPLEKVGSWTLDEGLGRRYGAVAGDRNPIHLHALTARPFGFPGPIAHGLWTAARLAAEVGAGLPDALTCVASFRKPVPLPSTVDVWADRAPDGAGPVRAQVRRQDAEGTVCCELSLVPGA